MKNIRFVYFDRCIGIIVPIFDPNKQNHPERDENANMEDKKPKSPRTGLFS